VRKEDFNFRSLSFLSALPSRSPLSFETIRHSRSPGGISLISCDNNNDERSSKSSGRRKAKEEQKGRGGRRKEDFTRFSWSRDRKKSECLVPFAAWSLEHGSSIYILRFAIV